MKKNSLWNDGMWKVDEEVGCHNCWWHWDNRCHANGKRFDKGYCNAFEVKENDVLHFASFNGHFCGAFLTSQTDLVPSQAKQFFPVRL